MGVPLRRVVSILILPLIAGCALSGELSSTGTIAPSVDASRQGVDGLEFGLRLMAAGEYELPLKACFRAASVQGMNADILSAVGSADLLLGRLNQTEQILRRAVTKDRPLSPRSTIWALS